MSAMSNRLCDLGVDVEDEEVSAVLDVEEGKEGEEREVRFRITVGGVVVVVGGEQV